MIETFFLISKKMTSTNMYDRGKNFRKLRSIWDNEPGNGKISKILSGVKKSAESHEENELFFYQFSEFRISLRCSITFTPISCNLTNFT